MKSDRQSTDSHASSVPLVDPLGDDVSALHGVGDAVGGELQGGGERLATGRVVRPLKGVGVQLLDHDPANHTITRLFL